MFVPIRPPLATSPLFVGLVVRSSLRDVTHVDELRLRDVGDGGMEESGVVEEDVSLRLQCAQTNRLKPQPRQLAQTVSL